MANTFTFEIRSRWSGRVMFEAELDMSLKTETSFVQLGAAVQTAVLRGAVLNCADLSCADLRGADLRGAKLRYAVLGGADLRGADLRGADLRGANLRGAKVTRLLATASRIDDPYQFFAWEQEDGGVWVTAGCRAMTTADYRQHVASEYPNTDKASETLAILDYFDVRAGQCCVSEPATAEVA